MEYLLKNGKTVIIRRPTIEDAEEIIQVVTIADTETRFMGRNPGEFNNNVQREREVIEMVLRDKDNEWLVAEYEGKVVGQAQVGLVRRRERYRHRAEVGFVIMEAYCNIGIGGKLMEECIQWCRDNGVTQVELDVVQGNGRAMKMYQGFGFEICGTFPKALRYLDGTYADEYRMIKFL